MSQKTTRGTTQGDAGKIKHTKVQASEEEMKASRGRLIHGVQKFIE